MECPACQKHIKAPNCQILELELVEGRKVHGMVCQKAVERANHEGLDKDERLKKVGDRFFNNLLAFALFKLAFY